MTRKKAAFLKENQQHAATKKRNLGAKASEWRPDQKPG
ncbi:hypothetical protein CGMCC3_g8587 [Colletotrichum fructicola]|nr:uncharacterized protein CGMCC3_g8587 [Colletotrichum fructicola]KAE9575318.1 hypothetical protein CGMCC3_g8587 [Colletotrichum fructicola]